MKTPHIHALIVPKLWCEKRKYYSLQNYRYFNGPKMLRDLQDSFAKSLNSQFPIIQRGCVGSKARHIDTKQFYTLMNNNLKEQNIETLQAKAAKMDLLKIKNNHMDKTLKSFQHFNKQKDEELIRKDETIELLLKEIQDLKKNNQYKDLKETLEATTEKKKGISRNFSGKRYNKSV